MNINIHKANERRFAEIMDTTLNTTRTVWEIMTLKTLHDDFGFGEKRLMQFADALRENYGGFNREMSLTDTYKNRTASNLDAALIRAVRDLRHDGIDYRKILDCGNVLIIVEKDGKKFSVDDCVDKNKPKALSEFGLTRPPQPWRYVEVSADEP